MSPTSIKLFISYAHDQVTTETVRDVFDTLFDNEVAQIEELTKQDINTGRPFKLFWITLFPSRHSQVWKFVDEIEKFGSACINYESTRGNEYWYVCISDV
jgi:Cu2+-containing amine oxidase